MSRSRSVQDRIFRSEKCSGDWMSIQCKLKIFKMSLYHSGVERLRIVKGLWKYLFGSTVVQRKNVCFVHSVTVVKQPSPPTFLPETSASTVHWTSPFSNCPLSHALHIPRINTGSRWWGHRVSLPLIDTFVILQNERLALLTWPSLLMPNKRMNQLHPWTSHHHSMWGFYDFKSLNGLVGP